MTDPRTCHLCGRPPHPGEGANEGVMDDGRHVCGHCWAEITFSREPQEAVVRSILERNGRTA